MSTKSTIYYQSGGPSGPDDIHVYWEMGGHGTPGFYIDLGSDVAKIEDPMKLADELKRVLTIHTATDAKRPT